MKTCPACGRSFPADAQFCVADGTPLAGASAVGELDRLLADADASLVAAPAAVAPAAVAPPAAPFALPPVEADEPERASSRGLGVVIALLTLLVLGMGGVAVWQRKAIVEQPRAVAPPEPPPGPAPEPVPEPAPEPEPAFTLTVWADSPRDGFLTLRSGPGIGPGTRLLDIPHGEPLALGECLSRTTSASGRVGSWCRARYSGVDGWVFDAFVSR